jgi:acetyl esterase
MPQVDRTLLRACASFAVMRAALPFAQHLAGPPPAVAPDLHPDAQLLSRLLDWSQRVTRAPDRAAARRVADVEPWWFSVRPDHPVRVTEIEGGREYLPAHGGERTLLWFHGGGWTMRSVRSHNPACKLLADWSGLRVLSMEYRLAPEHPFPAAADDCFAHYERLHEQVDAIGGDSAGGNLAASVLMTARDRDVPLPSFQWLLYPVLDACGPHASQDLFAEGFNLTKQAMAGAFDAYLPDHATRDDRRASPLLGDVSGFPPAYVATALADPLRDEGEAYAARLHTAGVPVTLDRFPLVHGFLNFTVTRSARAAVRRAAAALNAGVR